MKRIFVSESGNILMYILVALTAVGGLTSVIVKNSQESTRSLSSIETRANETYIETHLRIYLTDVDICTNTMMQAGVSFDLASPISSPVTISSLSIPLGDGTNSNTLEIGSNYMGGNIMIRNMEVQPPDVAGNEAILMVEFERTFNDLGAKSFIRRYPLKGKINGDLLESYCYLNEEIIDESGNPTTFEVEINKALSKVCNGSGFIDTNANPDSPQPVESLHCHFANQLYTDDPNYTDYADDPIGGSFNCPPGEALILHEFDETHNENNQYSQMMKYTCRSPHLPEDLDTYDDCPIGLKYDEDSGTFSCFSLSELVDDTIVNVSTGTNCRTAPGGGNRIRVTCE